MSRRDELFSEMIEKTKGAYAISIQGTFEYAFKAAIEEVRKWAEKESQSITESGAWSSREIVSTSDLKEFLDEA